MLSIHPEKVKLTTSSGSASGNTQNLIGICHEILCKPATESTQYDLTITNSDGIVVYEWTSEVGTIADLVSLPVRGIYTISLSSATRDELFYIQLVINE